MELTQRGGTGQDLTGQDLTEQDVPDGRGARAAGPTVSVVVPTHEREDLLVEAVRSATGQTRAPLEVLVVDDAGSAATREAVERGAVGSTVPVRYLHNAEGDGASSSRNLGAEHAVGDLVAFLDDDDLWHPRYLATAVRSLVQQDSHAVFTRLDRFAAAGRALPRDLRAADVVARNPGVSGSSIVVAKDAFSVAGGFDPQMWVSNDKDFLVRFLDAGLRYAVVDEPLVVWREHAGTRLTRSSPRRIAGLQQYYRTHRHRLARSDRRRLRSVIALDSRHLARTRLGRTVRLAQGLVLLGPGGVVDRRRLVRRMRPPASSG